MKTLEIKIGKGRFAESVREVKKIISNNEKSARFAGVVLGFNAQTKTWTVPDCFGIELLLRDSECAVLAGAPERRLRGDSPDSVVTLPCGVKVEGFW